MRTKLQAVQEVMRRVGKHPCNLLDTGGTSVEAHVERVLDDSIQTVQQDGWYWNTVYDVQLTPDTSTKKVEVGRLEPDADVDITSVGSADPTVITTDTDHGLKANDRIYITGTVGTTSLDDLYWRVGTVTSATVFSLLEVGSLSGHVGSTGTVTPLRTIYHVDAHGEDVAKEVTRRGDFLYDLVDNTEEFGASLKVRYVYERAYEDIPVIFQDWTIAMAALNFNRYYVGNRNSDGALQLELQTRQRQVMRDQIRQSDINVLDTQEMRQIRGRRRMPDRSVY